MLFVACGVVALVAGRRCALLLTGALTLGYFLLLDHSLSSNFFRIYLPLFPVFFLAVGRLADRPGHGPFLAWALVGLMLLAGSPALRPPGAAPLDATTPPGELLVEDSFMVNSGFYHPESLIYRFPDKRFIGMPLRPDRFERFRARYPSYEAILWHDFSVQDEIAAYLRESGRYEVVREGVNRHGRRYTVLVPR
jgi:hypothetical protein